MLGARRDGGADGPPAHPRWLLPRDVDCQLRQARAANLAELRRRGVVQRRLVGARQRVHGADGHHGRDVHAVPGRGQELHGGDARMPLAHVPRLRHGGKLLSDQRHQVLRRRVRLRQWDRGDDDGDRDERAHRVQHVLELRFVHELHGWHHQRQDAVAARQHDPRALPDRLRPRRRLGPRLLGRPQLLWHCVGRGWLVPNRPWHQQSEHRDALWVGDAAPAAEPSVRL
mmetsp:Transcript_26021/g.90590  ORF Transcript_26021/g.90590 Transcript_26021/m.90590 type:complete len:228 (-) Transcript_26021:67-750(-)